ncbi:MAG: isoleucine--tRNA ligase, partial [Pirellula sp.]
MLKDFVLKTHIMLGDRVPYVPGYDNHGLPIEQAVMKKLTDAGKTPTIPELRQACREHAAFFIKLQTEQFKRLGIFGMWDKSYQTMEYKYEAEIIRVFGDLVSKGYVYRGLRPVLWSPTCQTALADTEIVYQDVTSKAIYVRFPLKSDPENVLKSLENLFTVIWTTTPWTIPANLACAFHPKLSYAIVKVGTEHYLLLKDLVEKTAEKLGWSGYQVVQELQGEKLESLVFKHPIFERDSRAVLADYVTTEDGTGVVHTAPGHGRDDFYTGQKYGLPVLCPVNSKGVLTEEAGEFAGVYYKKCDKVVVDRLQELGHLLSIEDYRHSYPHAERDGNPVIFRATEQWFVNLDHDGLRQKMLAQIEGNGIKWYPKSGQTRLRNMIAGRPDWCISRQRPWGVGIPALFGKESDKPVLDPVAIEAIAKLVETKGSDAWYTDDPSTFLPDGYKHPETGETEFRKETDVFDVWFDSGCTALCVLRGNVHEEWKEKWPADVYSEGSDQHRGWFNVSMILGTAVMGLAPYKAIVTHGFITTEKGDKLSKRSGTAAEPIDICNKFGADVLRWWAASIDYTEDAPFGDNILAAAGEHYRTVRNTMRFLLSNLANFSPSGESELLPIDKHFVTRTKLVANNVMHLLANYDYRAASA